MTKPTFASVTEQSCVCRYLTNAAADPQSPIVFDPRLNEYNFVYPDPCADGTCGVGNASLRIYHCPFCGGAAPASKRHLLFAIISPEEQQRLDPLLAEIKSVEDAFRVLGAPSLDAARGRWHRRRTWDVLRGGGCVGPWCSWAVRATPSSAARRTRVPPTSAP